MFDLPQAIIEKRMEEKSQEDAQPDLLKDLKDLPQVIGDDIKAVKTLTGSLAKELDTLVAEDFCRAVAEAEKSISTVTPQRPGSAAPTGQRQAAQEAPRPLLTTDQAQQKQPAPPLMWLEVATMLAGGRPVQDVTTMVKERGISFDADPEALWSLEALGASDALLQAVRAARVENYYEPNPATWADFSAEAEHTFRRVLETQPSNPVLHYALARSLEGQEKIDAAIAEYRETLRLKPDFENAHMNLGVALGRESDLKGAIKELREVVRLSPGNAWGHDNLGVALDRKGDLDGSLAEHREAVRLKPDFVDAHLNLGAALDERGDLDRALVEYRQAVRLAPGYARAHYALGIALGRKDDLPGARLELQEALRLNPNDALTHYVLGNVLRYQGDLNGAVVEYREALRLRPDFPEAQDNLDAVLHLIG